MMRKYLDTGIGNMKSLFRVLLMIFAMSFCTLMSCKKEVIQSKLIITPQSISFNDSDTIMVSLSLEPPQKLEWLISEKPNWIKVSPNSGTINRESVEIQIIVDNSNLDPGEINDEIKFLTSGTGETSIEVSVHVHANPVLELNPSVLNFEEAVSKKQISLSNKGTGFLNWHIENDLQWLDLSLTQGTLRSSESINIEVAVDRKGQVIGTVDGNVSVNSNSVNGNIELSVSMAVPEIYEIEFSPEPLYFCFTDNQKSFSITNTGNSPVTWNIQAGNNPISANTSSGNLLPGANTEVILDLDRTNVVSGLNSFSALINYSTNKQKALPINVFHPDENFWLIDNPVIDAEFDRTNNFVITVSDLPPSIRKYCPETKTEMWASLDFAPTCVSVSQDGEYAAVGHNGKVSYVKLETMDVLHIYDVFANAIDIALAGNGWVYVVPSYTGYFTRINCLNLSSGEVSLSQGFHFSSGAIKVHHLNNSIYAVEWTDGRDIAKFSTEAGIAAFSYYKIQHHTGGRKLWLSDNSALLFTRLRRVYATSPLQSQDIRFLGTLYGGGIITTLDSFSDRNLICAIVNNSNEIRVFEYSSLAPIGAIPIPSFITPNDNNGCQIMESKSRFVFFNSLGNKVYVIVDTGIQNGGSNSQAIVSIELPRFGRPNLF